MGPASGSLDPLTGLDGQDVTFGATPAGAVTRRRVHLSGAPNPLEPDFYPIYGSTDDLTREHVPQRGLGGTVMTLSCQPCNNGLGSRVEDELRHWFDDAIFNVRFSGGDVQGKRRVPQEARLTA